MMPVTSVLAFADQSINCKEFISMGCEVSYRSKSTWAISRGKTGAMNVHNTTSHDLRPDEAGPIPFLSIPRPSYRCTAKKNKKTKTESQLNGGSKVRLKECRQVGMFVCASQAKSVLPERTTDCGE